MPGKRRGGRYVESSPRFIEALVAKEEREQAESAPIVRAGCTCTGSIRIDGVEYTGLRNPSCMEHGLHTRWPTSISLSSAEIRTPSKVHDPVRHK